MTNTDFNSPQQLNQHPQNTNPLIAYDHRDTLANINAVIQFLQSCDLYSEETLSLVQKNSADGLYLVLQSLLQALQFEIEYR